MRYYAYDKASGEILSGGGYYQPEINNATQGLYTISDDTTPHPDPRLKRVDNLGQLRDATTAEITAYDNELEDASAAEIADKLDIKAAVITSLWGRLNRQPTLAEINAEKNRYIQVHKLLKAQQ